MSNVTTLVWVSHLQKRMRLTVNIVKSDTMKSGSWVTVDGVDYLCYYTGVWRTGVRKQESGDVNNVH